jgi:hypothetical protein
LSRAHGSIRPSEGGFWPTGARLARSSTSVSTNDTQLIVLENTQTVHNLIVCTLCSCYPRPVLGLPPDWYKLKPYRARAVKEPRAVLAEFGTVIPDDIEIRVSDSTALVRYLVLPKRPEGTDAFDEAQLAALVTRDAMIGVVPVSL